MSDRSGVWFIDTSGRSVTVRTAALSCQEPFSKNARFPLTLLRLPYSPGKKRNGVLQGGLICTSEEDCTTLTDREGNVVFRWLVHSAQD